MKLLNIFALCIVLSIFSNTINAKQSYLGLKEVAIDVANIRKALQE